jgi:hypothetical protein
MKFIAIANLLNIIDAAITQQIIQNYFAVELNPVLNLFGGYAIIFKLTVMLGLSAICYKEKIEKVMVVPITFLMVAIAFNLIQAAIFCII